MKVAQTELTEAEYSLLASYAEKHGMSLKEALREATRLLVLSDKVDPEDPIFSLSVIPGSGKNRMLRGIMTSTFTVRKRDLPRHRCTVCSSRSGRP